MKLAFAVRLADRVHLRLVQVPDSPRQATAVARICRRGQGHPLLPADEQRARRRGQELRGHRS